MKKYWNNIRKNYPKTFDKLVKDHSTIKQWGTIDNPNVWGIFVEEPQWVLRHLYDFFDSKGLNIWVFNPVGKGWFYGILNKKTGLLIETVHAKYTTRKKCELDAWERGFKIMEERVTKKK